MSHETKTLILYALIALLCVVLFNEDSNFQRQARENGCELISTDSTDPHQPVTYIYRCRGGMEIKRK